jgi:alkanesulfonate monooxygenase SsuD/methylene tetrahydromethanopterin reductase-like flavin-dependent oxidoreductase (luciferase family)
MLGAWAEQTSRVQIGALVTCNSYRNPELLADMARTVDHISGGRLILGIGAAGSRRTTTSSATSSAPPAPGSRTWHRPCRASRPAGRPSNPVPTRQIPVMIGGGGERKTLRVVAEHADLWHSFGNVDTLVRKSAILDEHGADVGRDTATLVERSIGVGAPPSEVADALVAAGVTLFTVGTGGPDYDLSLAAQWVAWRDAQG